MAVLEKSSSMKNLCKAARPKTPNERQIHIHFTEKSNEKEIANRNNSKRYFAPKLEHICSPRLPNGWGKQVLGKTKNTGRECSERPLNNDPQKFHTAGLTSILSLLDSCSTPLRQASGMRVRSLPMGSAPSAARQLAKKLTVDLSSRPERSLKYLAAFSILYRKKWVTVANLIPQMARDTNIVVRPTYADKLLNQLVSKEYAVKTGNGRRNDPFIWHLTQKGHLAFKDTAEHEAQKARFWQLCAECDDQLAEFPAETICKMSIPTNAYASILLARNHHHDQETAM